MPSTCCTAILCFPPDIFKTPARVSQVLSAGDVIYVEPTAKDSAQYRMRQIPEISGAIVVMDPNGVWKSEWGDLFRDTEAGG